MPNFTINPNAFQRVTPVATTQTPSLPVSSNPAEPLSFRAFWNASNEHLKDTTSAKVTRFFLCIINFIVKRAILPSAMKSTREIEVTNQSFNALWTGDTPQSRFLRSHYTPQPFEATTPDGVKVRGTYFKNNALQQNAPTVLCFQPNAATSKTGNFNWLMEKTALYDLPCHFITFDYRGTGGGSESGPVSDNELILDGETLYQFARTRLGIDPQNIHFYGWSLGGGVSANVKALHPEATGNYVNERSFASLRHFVGSLIKRIFSALNWKLDSESAMQKITGRTLVVHHPQDEVAGSGKGLNTALFSANAPRLPNVTELDLSRGAAPQSYLHGCRMEEFNTATFKPEEEIIQFLLNSPQPCEQRLIGRFNGYSDQVKNRTFAIIAESYQDNGFWWRSGEHAFNRNNLLHVRENQRIQAIFRAKMECA